MSLGNAIRNARIRQRLSTQGLADLLGVSRAAVSQWETGAGKPSAKHRRALAETLGIEAAEMLQIRIDDKNQVAEHPAYETDDGLSGGARRLTSPAGQYKIGLPLLVYSTHPDAGDSMLMSNEPSDEEPMPAFAYSVRGSFGVLLCSDDMKPAYNMGDRLLIFPERPVYPGRDVLLMKPDRLCKVRHLVDISDTHWHIKSYNPPQEKKLSRMDWPKALWIESVRRR